MNKVKDLEELEKKYENMSPKEEMKLFLKDYSTFRKRAMKLIPEIHKISDILIGVIRLAEGKDVYITLQGRSKNKKKLVKINPVFNRSYATQYGEIEEGLPVAFVVYKAKGSTNYENALIPWDINAPKDWIPLRSNFDYSRFSPKSK